MDSVTASSANCKKDEARAQGLGLHLHLDEPIDNGIPRRYITMNNWMDMYNIWRSAPDAQPYFISCAQQEMNLQEVMDEIAVGLCMVNWLRA
jgi:hypothetical protein